RPQWTQVAVPVRTQRERRNDRGRRELQKQGAKRRREVESIGLVRIHDDQRRRGRAPDQLAERLPGVHLNELETFPPGLPHLLAKGSVRVQDQQWSTNPAHKCAGIMWLCSADAVAGSGGGLQI